MRRPVLILRPRRTRRRHRRARRGAGNAPTSRHRRMARRKGRRRPGRGRRPRQGRAGGDTFPAQQRPPGDPAVIARGKMLYEVACASCHGIDLRGGQLNGPNLLRSQVVLNDQQGELILPIVHGARAEKGMPALPIPPRRREGDRGVHPQRHRRARAARARRRAGSGRRPTCSSATRPPGATYFAAKCSTLPFADRRPAGHRQRGSRMPRRCRTSGSRAAASADAAVGGRRRRAGGRAPRRSAARGHRHRSRCPAREGRRAGSCATTTSSSRSRWPTAPIRTFRRDGDTPKVEVNDPFEPHRALLPTITEQGHARRDGVSLDGEMTIKKLLLDRHADRCCCRSSLAGQGRGVDARRPPQAAGRSWPTYSGDYTGGATAR